MYSSERRPGYSVADLNEETFPTLS